jgi:hypothetical protein
MSVTITAKVGFAHGHLNIRRGDEADVSEATAKELEKAGLAFIGKAPAAPVGPAAPKTPAKGGGAKRASQPSSASQVQTSAQQDEASPQMDNGANQPLDLGQNSSTAENAGGQ